MYISHLCILELHIASVGYHNHTDRVYDQLTEPRDALV